MKEERRRGRQCNPGVTLTLQKNKSRTGLPEEVSCQNSVPSSALYTASSAASCCLHSISRDTG
eukprot:1538197-Rhodomonas_salina.1